MESNDNHG
jgi:hypothetical protein